MQQQKPLEGAQLVIMTIALSLATFMQVLDSTIANVAIPTIAGNLGSSLSQGTWVITSFGVANAISIPLTGWLAKRVGEVKLFLWSTIAFAIASWACGVSSSLNMLIFFRVIQGIVAGPLIPLSQSLLLNNYPPAKRSIALALWSMTVIVAPICGPILGGYITFAVSDLLAAVFHIKRPVKPHIILIRRNVAVPIGLGKLPRIVSDIGVSALYLMLAPICGDVQQCCRRQSNHDYSRDHREKALFAFFALFFCHRRD